MTGPIEVSGGPDVWIVKTDSIGNLEWNITEGGLDYDVGYSLIQTIDGGYAVAGLTRSFGAGTGDGWLIKLAPEITWEYVFEDSCRGTTLKISTDDQHFQFITPDKEFTIKHDSNMRVWECRCTTSIFICYADDEITLTAIAFDGRYKVCMAFAKDMQTGKSYVLVDKPRWPGFHGRCYAK